MGRRPVPNAPAVYAMYGGEGREYVAYVGLGDKLRRRVEQHLINRDSSVTTGTKPHSTDAAPHGCTGAARGLLETNRVVTFAPSLKLTTFRI
jgi:hypothetical protein